MKKKKLKKKIKKLEKKVDYLAEKLCGTKEAITRIENDNRYYKEWIDTNPSTEDIQRQISELKSKISCHDNRLSVLDARSRVDYTMYSTNKEENK